LTYGSLLGSTRNREHPIDLQSLGIPSHDLADLDIPFSEKEVWETIKQLPSDKAPGLDVFTGAFYKTCWPLIKGDIMTAMSAVWSRKFMNFGNLNSAYITLIPKLVGAEQVKDFRPISLVHSFAKIVTKLLANRLAGRLHGMVSPIQRAFIKGRFIQDNLCWYNRQQDSCISKNNHTSSSNSTFKRPLIQSHGLFFWK
jgi:hypothetical protein